MVSVTGTVIPASAPPPVIASFTLNGDPSTAKVAPGVAMTLVWTVTGATNVQVMSGSNTDQGWYDQPASGSATVSAQGSRNFSLRASSDGGNTWPTYATVHSIVTEPSVAPNLTGAPWLDSTLKIPDFCFNVTVKTLRSGNASDPTIYSTGKLPGASDVLWVMAGHVLTVDAVFDVPINGIGVRPGGSLIFLVNAKVRQTACHVVVYDTDGVNPQGLLQIGASANPVNPNSVQNQTAALCLCSAPYSPVDTSKWGAHLYVYGKIVMYGQPVEPGFMRLAKAPKAGDRTLSLSAPVTGWTQGDRLFLHDSHSLNYNERSGSPPGVTQSEALMLESVSADGLTLTVSSVTGGGLAFAHPGSFRPDNTLPTEYFPFVANLSRWASIRSTDPTDINRPGVFFSNRATVDIRNAAIHGCGRATPFVGRSVQFRRFWGPVGGMGYDATVDPPEYQPGNPLNTTGANGPSGRFINNSVVDPFPIAGQPLAGAQWGLSLDEASWVLAKGNVVVNWGGGGIVVHNGNERQNAICGNFIGLIRGSGGRGDLSGIYTAGTGAFDPYGQGQGAGIWCRNPSQHVYGNVVADVRQAQSTTGHPAAGVYAWGISFNPIKDSSAAPLDPFPYTPAYQGSNPYSGVQSDAVTYSPAQNPILDFHDNEIIGGMNGFTWWDVKKVDYTELVQNAPMSGSGGTILRNVCWAIAGYGSFCYPALNVTLDSCVFRGGADLQTNNWPSQGVFADDYPVEGMSLVNCDIQGFQIGVQCLKMGQGSLNISGCFLNNLTNILCPVFNTSAGAILNNLNYSLNSDAGGLHWDYTVTIADCTYGVVPHQPLKSIVLGGQSGPSIPTSAACLTRKETVLVVNHNGVQGDDFQAYWLQQLPSYVLPQTNPASTLVACPAAGLTNQQSHDKYNLDGTVKANWPDPTTPGICFGGALLPAGYSTRPDIVGYVK